MGHLILNNLDESLVERLQSRAAAHGRTVEEEHRAILEEALAKPRTDFWEKASALRESIRGRDFSDTTAIIRAMRDERAGLSSEAGT